MTRVSIVWLGELSRTRLIRWIEQNPYLVGAKYGIMLVNYYPITAACTNHKYIHLAYPQSRFKLVTTGSFKFLQFATLYYYLAHVQAFIRIIDIFSSVSCMMYVAFKMHLNKTISYQDITFKLMCHYKSVKQNRHHEQLAAVMCMDAHTPHTPHTYAFFVFLSP